MPIDTEGGTRTLTPLRELDFESSASANSATSASPLNQRQVMFECIENTARSIYQSW